MKKYEEGGRNCAVHVNIESGNYLLGSGEKKNYVKLALKNWLVKADSEPCPPPGEAYY